MTTLGLTIKRGHVSIAMRAKGEIRRPNRGEIPPTTRRVPDSVTAQSDCLINFTEIQEHERSCAEKLI